MHAAVSSLREHPVDEDAVVMDVDIEIAAESLRKVQPSGLRLQQARALRFGLVPIRHREPKDAKDGRQHLRIGRDGSVSAEAIDRLSIMARPPGVARPTLPLPDEPADDAAMGEWLPSVRLLSPRLVWLVQQIAETYPRHGIYIVSGYRTGPNEGVHAQGRALDLQVMGVSNERLYRACRRFRDVGCGYYPNHAFVHIDVRPGGTGSRYWVDVSEPGQPSDYVTAWPGVEDGRGARFDAGTR